MITVSLVTHWMTLIIFFKLVLKSREKQINKRSLDPFVIHYYVNEKKITFKALYKNFVKGITFVIWNHPEYRSVIYKKKLHLDQFTKYIAHLNSKIATQCFQTLFIYRENAVLGFFSKCSFVNDHRYQFFLQKSVFFYGFWSCP